MKGVPVCEWGTFEQVAGGTGKGAGRTGGSKESWINSPSGMVRRRRVPEDGGWGWGGGWPRTGGELQLLGPGGRVAAP